MNPSKRKKLDSQSVSEQRRVTLRDIAAEMGISHVTVSKALRNLTGVSVGMRVKICAKAEEMGYVPDPLLASLSRYRSQSKTKPIHSGIAWINTWEEPDELWKHREFKLYWQGANDSAERQGYRLEAFNTAEIPLPRLARILKSRNICGVLLPPLGCDTDSFEGFDLGSFAVVRFGQATPFPNSHFVSSAQIANVRLALEKVQSKGYQRVGFVCEYMARRYFGAGYTWLQRELSTEQRLPLLALNPSDRFEQQQVEFENWLRQYEPDAIITDNSETLTMLTNLGYRVPEELGLVTTSIDDTSIDTGIDQNPYEIGRAAIRMLTALMAERSYGIPECRNEILIEGKWVDGSMLRTASARNDS